MKWGTRHRMPSSKPTPNRKVASVKIAACRQMDKNGNWDLKISNINLVLDIILLFWKKPTEAGCFVYSDDNLGFDPKEYGYSFYDSLFT